MCTVQSIFSSSLVSGTFGAKILHKLKHIFTFSCFSQLANDLSWVVTYKKGFKWTSVIITLAQGVKTVRKAQIRLDFCIGNYILEWKIVQRV